VPRSTINSTLKDLTNKQPHIRKKTIIMSKTVFGIATTHGQAERIVEQLQAQGFAASEISVLMPDTGGTRDVGHVKATKAPEGATTGAAIGGATGGVIGLLAGIESAEINFISERVRVRAAASG
jgi:hypothetical protein